MTATSDYLNRPLRTLAEVLAKTPCDPEYDSFLDELDAAGYRIVPKVPTAEMIREGHGVTDYPRGTYLTMLAAAPKVAP
jgi:hypothetical protein